MNFQFLFTTKWGQPLFSIMRSSPALWFIWGFEIYCLHLATLLLLRLHLLRVPLQSVLGHGFTVWSPCLFLLQKALNLCLCICSKFTLSTEYLSTVLLSKAPAAGYSLRGIASLSILHGPAAFCLCLSHLSALFSLASCLCAQPVTWWSWHISHSTPWG